jgi:hypothetical protein
MFRRLIDINLTGTFICAQAAGNAMIKANTGGSMAPGASKHICRATCFREYVCTDRISLADDDEDVATSDDDGKALVRADMFQREWQAGWDERRATAERSAS